jgi:hypothetical protein
LDLLVFFLFLWSSATDSRRGFPLGFLLETWLSYSSYRAKSIWPVVLVLISLLWVLELVWLTRRDWTLRVRHIYWIKVSIKRIYSPCVRRQLEKTSDTFSYIVQAILK